VDPRPLNRLQRFHRGYAFGRGKRVICMDGLDLHEALSRELSFDLVLEQKVRWAAERGNVFAQVGDFSQAADPLE
jgi:hypothetical protein